MRPLLIVCLVISLLAFKGCRDKEGLVLFNLRCENLENPLGIDTTTPRFSWKIKSDKNGTEQKAFQLMVASNLSELEKDNPDYWNSGKIESSSGLLVPYQGEKLKPGSVGYWKVRVWDESGKASPWSPASEFSIGLLDEEHWQASYIRFPTYDGSDHCPQLRKSFNLENKEERMLLHVNSLGYHEVYLNGEKAGNGVLSPAVSQYDKRSLIITYDLSSMVNKGHNDIILWLGSGWYKSGLPGVLDEGPLVKAQLEQIGGKQRKIVLITDSSWLGRKSNYIQTGSWRSRNFGGEELSGASTAGDLSSEALDKGVWNPVELVEVPQHEVSPQVVQLNRITETIKPASISNISEKTYLVDMGKNLTGWVKISFPKLYKSQEIIMEYADHLYENGQLANQGQVDRYIAAGEGREIFQNKFNYQGFRYMKISNLDEPPSLDSISAYLIETGYQPASSFMCSDPDMNDIHDMVHYTLRCLSLGGYLVDCPQIERLGYGGDGNASTLTAQTMFNMGPLYENWLQAWADCMREDGSMPHTAPNPYPAGGGPYWCGFIITASWDTYMNYGDTAILEKYYPYMQKWLEYVEKYSPDGLLERWPDTDYRNWYLGDWATPEGVDQKAEASVDLVNNCFIAVCYDYMQKIANILDKESDAGIYSKKSANLKKLIHQTFFDDINYNYSTGTQIDLTYPLLAGVVPEKFTTEVVKSLINEISNNHNGHFATGLVGIPVFTEWAIKNQEAELMYSMLKKKDYPGYLYMIENGATTTWEHWDGRRSRIHNCYNGIGSWFYQALGGIRPYDPAFSKVLIQPQIPDGITWTRASKETPYGTLSVNWETEGKSFNMELDVPVGMEAEMPLPRAITQYSINGEILYIDEDDSRLIRIKSGRYDISYSPYK